MVGEGDVVATFVTGEGTNNGPFMGRPASGKHAKWNSTGFFRVRDGRIVETLGRAGSAGDHDADRRRLGTKGDLP